MWIAPYGTELITSVTRNDPDPDRGSDDGEQACAPLSSTRQAGPRFWIFYNDLLKALGAPKGHGERIDALIDSMIWDGMNAVEPPYTIRIRNIERSPKAAIDEIQLARRYLAEAREEFQTRHGRDVDIRWEIVSE